MSKIDWQDLFLRFKKYRWQLAGAFLFLILFSAIEVIKPLLLKKVVDTYVPGKNLQAIYKVSLIYLGLLIFSTIFSYFYSFLLTSTGFRLVNSLKVALFRNILRQDREFFSQNTVGSLLARIESDTEVLKDLFSARVGRVFTLVFILLGIVISLSFTMGWVGVIFSLYALIIIFIIYKLLSIIRGYYEVVREKYKNLSSLLAEYLKAIPLIRFYQVEDGVEMALKKANYDKYQNEKKAAVLNYSSTAFLYFISSQGLGLVLVIYFGIGFLVEGRLTLGDLLVIIQYVRRFFSPLIHFSEEILSLQSSFVALERVYKYLHLKPQIMGGDKSLDRSRGIEIEFDRVWFAYKGEEWVLKDVSFKICCGEKVGLVGESGAGKSTIFKLLLRFYDVNKGRILINGIDIREYKLEELRGVFSLITQESNLFYGTVKENLTMLDESTEDEKIWKATQKLGIEKEFERFCPQLDALLSDGGSNFSSGERQLLAFIRAVLLERDVFLFDEATAFVDPHTERVIQEALQHITEDKTLLLVAHRLSTVKELDRILVFENGELKEMGTHEELLQLQGKYQKLLEYEKGGKKVVEN